MDRVVYIGDTMMGKIETILHDGMIITSKDMFPCTQKMLRIVEVDSYEDFINDLLIEMKQNKILELSQACNAAILSGFISSAYQNIEKHYDCDYTDQSRIAGLVSIAQLRLLNLSAETIKWKETNALECVEWTPEEILQLGLDLKRHIESKTDKFYQLRIQVLDCTTKEEINNIVW